MKTAHAADRIDYNQPFRENVQGQLKATFRLGADFAPVSEPHPDDRRLLVYTIDAFLDSPRASQIDRVEYFLDDPSYEDPKGYSNDRSNQFRKEITSYGDVEVLVTVYLDGLNYQQRAWLSNMLENGHADDMTAPIWAALERIRVN